MALTGRARDIVASRRRQADDGEEDETGSLDDESQSEASALTVANESADEATSELSGTRRSPARKPDSRGSPLKQRKDSLKPVPSNTIPSQTISDTPVFTNTADMEAMANGLSPPSDINGAGTLQFEDSDVTHHLSQPANGQAVGNENRVQSKGTRVPPKITTTVVPDAARAAKRRGREPSGLAYSANPLQPGPSSTTDRWSHDLHDMLENDMPSKPVLPIVEDISRRNLPVYGSAKGPEPLSRTVTVGHITLRISLPGMSQPIPYEKTPLRYHIRLPDLRPPLRRDKPVRVSLPGHPQRYIFPNVDRSFIFIPRAQRPNQQGRRPFGSRRNSLFGGSSYTPSIAMSRRSSVARDGIISPAGSSITKPPFGAPMIPARPVVKLPVGARPSMPMQNGYGHPAAAMVAPIDGMSEPLYPPPGKPALQSQWNGPIHVHQPRPQKTVSVTNIESPSQERLHAPQQHEHQPFHHQVPTHVNGANAVPDTLPTHTPYSANNFSGGQTVGTPAQLPNNAVNAQPFQPDQQAVYYPAPYPMQDMMYYPGPENSTPSYVSQQMMAPPMYMQPTIHGSYLVPVLSPVTVPTMAPVPEAPQGTSAYEQNGTVYFYNPAQYGNESHMNGNAYPVAGGNTTAKPNGNDVYYNPVSSNYYPQQQ